MNNNVVIALFFVSIWLASGLVRAETPYQACDTKITLPLEVWSSGWSRDYTQQRMYSEEQAGLTAADLPSMDVAWTFAFKDTQQLRSLPAMTAQAIFIGSDEGVFALDTQRGCGYWRFQSEGQVRTAITLGHFGEKWLLFFGDSKANAYAINAENGELVWKQKLDNESLSVITGSPVVYEENVFFPVSSWEVGLAGLPWYSCCKFRGSLNSINALTGKLNWKSFSVPEEPKPTYRNMFGAYQYGPSGAGLWSAPTIDVKRQRIYIGSGENYSSPAEAHSDALIAFDLHTGKQVWSKQVLAEDAWNGSCGRLMPGMNCPKENGQDYDIGATTILVTRKSDGKDIILAGAKSGMAYAMDPDKQGEILWQNSVGRGGLVGGIHWGMAADNEYLYAPVADTNVDIVRKVPGAPRPGLSKIRLSDGERIWFTSTLENCNDANGKPKANCRPGLSAAITGIPGAILAPALDGYVRAFDPESGKEIWKMDTTKTVTSVNGVEGHGGTMDAGGVVVTHGMMLFTSGYGGFISIGSKGGNVFYVMKKKTISPPAEPLTR
jgi:polyvinyl alcohol dehydrogenase (cytochrome)